MIDLFQELITDFGKVLHLSLHLDQFHACSIKVPPVIVQLQLDTTQEDLFLFAKVIEIPPGRFREDILSEALKTNATQDPVAGIFSYISATNHLALYQKYPLSILNGERLANYFGGFLEIAQNWHKAIEAGQSAPSGTQKKLPPPHGIKP